MPKQIKAYSSSANRNRSCAKVEIATVQDNRSARYRLRALDAWDVASRSSLFRSVKRTSSFIAANGVRSVGEAGLLALIALSASTAALAQSPPVEANVRVDFSTTIGAIRPLHGVNNGPITRGENADLSGYHATAGFPHTRLHDVHWPHPDVVDVSTIFPLFHADPDDPANYTFAKTDDYIAAIVRNKSQVIFRLGESIEPWTTYHNHPPADFERWAKICVHIVRHYNDGWANGFRHGIVYWEVWNEPESAFMWRGTRDQYFELYEVTARAIKAHDPQLRVGGPAATDPEGAWVVPFLHYCRDRNVPLDFFSWHLYRGTPAAYAQGAAQVRRTLDEAGFTSAQSHLNEWRYWPTWEWLRPKDPKLYAGVRDKFAATVNQEGAGFVAVTLLGFQDVPLDVANYYTADTSAWGMFDAFGVPSPTYHAFRAFHELAQRPERVRSDGPSRHGVAVCAGLAPDKTSACVLIGQFHAAGEPVSVALGGLPWSEQVDVELFRLDTAHDGGVAERIRLDPQKEAVQFETEANGVYWMVVRPAAG